jgi:hypothetical protein
LKLAKLSISTKVNYQCFADLPMVDDVMEERRPSTHENGRDMAIAPVPIFVTCKREKIRSDFGIQ